MNSPRSADLRASLPRNPTSGSTTKAAASAARPVASARCCRREHSDRLVPALAVEFSTCRVPFFTVCHGDGNSSSVAASSRLCSAAGVLALLAVARPRHLRRAPCRRMQNRRAASGRASPASVGSTAAQSPAASPVSARRCPTANTNSHWPSRRQRRQRGGQNEATKSTQEGSHRDCASK